MNIILLSGGSGKRLWPLSNDIRSKQFIKIFPKKNKDELESMVERIYRGLKNAVPDAKITVATGKSQVSSLRNQLGSDVDICIEPTRRDTFPAIALAASYVKDVLKADEEEPVVVCPVDPFVDDSYFETIAKMGEAVKNKAANLYLMGIQPTYPSEKYGYILTNPDGSVKGFREKPDLETAKQYLKENAYWNGGVFAFRLGYVLDKAHELLDFEHYADLKAKYAELTKISFDYAVVEKETSISVVPFSGEWKDLGTWNTLTEAMQTNVVGNAILADSCENVHVINELDVPILCMGLKDTVVAASADGILVSDKHESSYMKPFVEDLTGPVMYAEKSWGSYRVMDVESESMTVKVTLNPGNKMNYHAHQFRDEVWNVLEGTGTVILNGVSKSVKPGDVIELPHGMKHTIIANDTLKVMEVQIGENIRVDDKIKYEL